MMIDPGSIGIDVCKQHLDVFDGLHGRSGRIANTREAVAELIASLAGRDVFVVFEATGRYDGRLRDGLAAAGVPFARVNPARARDFARALGVLAKTDALDARVLAAMGSALRPRPQAIGGAAEEAARRRLRDLHRRRDQLVAMRQQERLRLAEIEGAEIEGAESEEGERDSLRRHIAWLDGEIRDLEAKRAALIAADTGIGRLYRLLLAIPGIGPVTATTLIALMPELGNRSPKAVAALAGLAPFNVDSGRFRGTRTIRGGRKRVRDALYMAALSAWRSKSRLGAFATALIARGKPFKLAIVALARKILAIANAVLRDRQPYRA